MRDIILFGMQGSGKGTQARLLLDRGDFRYFSVGDILRAHVADSSDPLAEEIRGYMARGALVPDEIIFSVLAHFLKEALFGQQPIIFDGFPRTLPQYKLLRKILDGRGRQLCAVYFDLSLGETLARIAHRRTSANGSAGPREDDTDMRAVFARLQAFYVHTFPVVYENILTDDLLLVDARPEPEKVYQEMMAQMRAKYGLM